MFEGFVRIVEKGWVRDGGHSQFWGKVVVVVGVKRRERPIVAGAIERVDVQDWLGRFEWENGS